jgi:hypothetical protein
VSQLLHAALIVKFPPAAAGRRRAFHLTKQQVLRFKVG